MFERTPSTKSGLFPVCDGCSDLLPRVKQKDRNTNSLIGHGQGSFQVVAVAADRTSVAMLCQYCHCIKFHNGLI